MEHTFELFDVNVSSAIMIVLVKQIIQLIFIYFDFFFLERLEHFLFGDGPVTIMVKKLENSFHPFGCQSHIEIDELAEPIRVRNLILLACLRHALEESLHIFFLDRCCRFDRLINLLHSQSIHQILPVYIPVLILINELKNFFQVL